MIAFEIHLLINEELESCPVSSSILSSANPLDAFLLVGCDDEYGFGLLMWYLERSENIDAFVRFSGIVNFNAISFSSLPLLSAKTYTECDRSIQIKRTDR